jgi:hypothetical protein
VIPLFGRTADLQGSHQVVLNAFSIIAQLTFSERENLLLAWIEFTTEDQTLTECEFGLEQCFAHCKSP